MMLVKGNSLPPKAPREARSLPQPPLPQILPTRPGLPRILPTVTGRWPEAEGAAELGYTNDFGNLVDDDGNPVR